MPKDKDQNKNSSLQGNWQKIAIAAVGMIVSIILGFIMLQMQLLSDRLSDLEIQDAKIDNELEAEVARLEETNRNRRESVAMLEARVLRLEAIVTDIEGDLERVANE